MPDLLLGGCTSLPLANYLKALGVFRLVAEQLDPHARVAWTERGLRLRCSVNEEGLLSFFLEEYRPTPLLAPWNGGSGFFYKWDVKKRQFRQREACHLVEAFAGATQPRLKAFASAIASVRVELDRLSRTIDPAQCNKEELDSLFLLKGPDGTVRAIERVDKGTLLRILRARLPDQVLFWLDAAFVLEEGGQATLPLLGSGGNDGNLDYSITALGNLRSVIALDEGDPTPNGAAGLLRWALIADAPVALHGGTAGQFDPGGYGGPNSGEGFWGRSLVNPWDVVLAFEGALLFAGAAVRRFGTGGARAAFPFCVTTTPAGNGTVAASDASTSESRAEIWMPLWTRWLSYPEVRAFLGEGRAQAGRAQAQTGVDFARAVASLGVDRGVDEFQRFGLFKRAGRMYVAAPLGRYRVRGGSRGIRLADEIESWLARARSADRTGRMPARFSSALRSVDDAIFDLARTGADDYRHAEKLIRSVGCLAQVAASSRVVQEVLPPLRGLSRRWVEACGPGPEPRLALALASIGPPAIRRNVEPVEIADNIVRWQQRTPSVVWRGRLLESDLADVLERRVIDALAEESLASGHPLRGAREAQLEDVSAFLAREVDDDRLSDLFRVFLALEPEALSAESASAASLSKSLRPNRALPRQWVLFKLVLSPTLPKGEETVGVDLQPELVRLVRTNPQRAVQLATRRLQILGLPVFTKGPGAARRELDFLPGGIDPDRLAAALLLPVWRTRELQRLLLAPTDDRQRIAHQKEAS